MKMKIAFTFIALAIAHTHPVFAQGDKAGGGGDTKTELRIKEIRNNILGWINSGRAEALTFPKGITYEQYLNGDGKNPGMLELLQEGKVVVTAILEAQENLHRDDLNTRVNGQPKTCKGFWSRKDSKLHILCNVERFELLNAQEQYQQVHHEYASLGLIERNTGADSDYAISRQLTDKGEYRSVWMLPIEPETGPIANAKNCTLEGFDLLWKAYPRTHRWGSRNEFDLDGEVVNGYSIHNIAPGSQFSLDLNRLKNSTMLTLTHVPTGIQRTVELTDRHRDELAYGMVIYDPKNAEIMEAMKAAKTIHEYVALKAQLNPKGDRHIPGVGLARAYLMALPSCAEMLQQ